MPTALEKKKFVITLPKNLYSKRVYNRAGQKASFRCSQTLSLTAENIPTKIFSPENSKVKCSILPRIMIKIIPTNSNLKITFRSSTSVNKILLIKCVDKRFYGCKK